MPHRILIFDSGLGGLSIARAVARQISEADIVYAADNEWFPYGDWPQDQLVERICAVAAELVPATAPDVMVVACNTASTLALEALRRRFDIPIVGAVPAIKPAAEFSDSGIIGVLATPGTVERQYTRALIDTYAFHREVVLHGCRNLAAMAEATLHGQTIEPDALATEIAPVFVERNGQRTDAVVLGCTHYPLIAGQIEAAAPWPVRFIDPSDAIARQVAKVAGSGKAAKPPLVHEPATALLTKRSAKFAGVLYREGFTSGAVLNV